MFEERGQFAFPERDGLPHFRQIARQIVDLVDVCKDAAGEVGNRAHAGVEKPLDHVRQDAKLGKPCRKGATLRIGIPQRQQTDYPSLQPPHAALRRNLGVIGRSGSRAPSCRILRMSGFDPIASERPHSRSTSRTIV